MADAETVTPVQPVVITFPAEIDMANAGQLGNRLTSALAAGAATVVADMTATTFCDSSCIGMLVTAHKRATAQSAQLRVVIASVRVLRDLAITKVDTVLRIYPSLDAALAPGPPAGARHP